MENSKNITHQKDWGEEREKLKNKIYILVKQIKKGKTRSYKQIASKARCHPRTVAAALRQNFNLNIPCHRIIMSSGKLGGYNRGVKLKRKLLKQEKAI